MSESEGVPLRQRGPTRPWEEDPGVRSGHAVRRQSSHPLKRRRSCHWRQGRSTPPAAQVSTPLQSERKGRNHGEQGAQGPRSAAPGEEKRLLSAQSPRPDWRRDLCDLGVGSDLGPPPPAPVSPGVRGPPAYSGGLQVSRTIEGLRRPSSGSGHLSDLRSICPAVCQQPSPQKMGEQREGAVLGPLRKFRVLGTPPRPLTLSVSPRVIGAAQETLGPCWAQLPLLLCLSVFVSVSVWLFPSLSLLQK